MRYRFVILIVLLVSLVGCAGTASAPPRPATALRVTDAPDWAYQKSLLTLANMGGVLAEQDPKARIIQAHIGGTRVVTVQVTPTEGGSLIQARGHVAMAFMSGMLSTSVAEDFLQAYQRIH